MPHFGINQRCFPREKVCALHRYGVRHAPFSCAAYSVLLCGLRRFLQSDKATYSANVPKQSVSEPIEVTNINQVENFLQGRVAKKPGLSGIWDPGSFTADLEIPSNEKIGTYGWCSIDTDTLNENLGKIQILLQVDGNSVDVMKFGWLYYSTQSQQYCAAPASMMLFPAGYHDIVLTIRFKDQINDGWEAYPKGDWIYNVRLTSN